MKTRQHVPNRTKALVLALGLALAPLGMSNSALADEPADNSAEVESARAATESLLNGLVAAVLNITSLTTQENVGPNSQAISLLLPHVRPAYRLLDLTGEPIDRRNRPRGRAEREAAEAAEMGEITEIVRRRRLDTYVPLTIADENCVQCHGNYAELDPSTVVGVIALSVPFPRGDEDDDD